MASLTLSIRLDISTAESNAPKWLLLAVKKGTWEEFIGRENIHPMRINIT
jgi:hypothetical protein